MIKSYIIILKEKKNDLGSSSSLHEGTDQVKAEDKDQHACPSI